jgi:hypothetical protein
MEKLIDLLQGNFWGGNFRVPFGVPLRVPFGVSDSGQRIIEPEAETCCFLIQ